jgi:ribosomal protein L11 methylase PrmA
VFPHSFADDIVHALALEWKLGSDNKILDPFTGAGTTVLAAKQLGIPAIGFDLSPLAVLTNTNALNDIT